MKTTPLVAKPKTQIFSDLPKKEMKKKTIGAEFVRLRRFATDRAKQCNQQGKPKSFRSQFFKQRKLSFGNPFVVEDAPRKSQGYLQSILRHFQHLVFFAAAAAAVEIPSRAAQKWPQMTPQFVGLIFVSSSIYFWNPQNSRFLESVNWHSAFSHKSKQRRVNVKLQFARGCHK